MKLFAFCKEETSEVSKLLVRIIGTFDGVLEENEDFAVFHSLKEMLPSFAKALEQGKNIVLALDKDSYNADRKKLCAALSLKEEENTMLLELLSKVQKVSSEEKKAHAMMPKDAIVFPSENGLYSGFMVEKGSQSIFFFPLEDKSLKNILKHGVSPFMMERAMQDKETAKENIAEEIKTKTQEEPQEAYVDLNTMDSAEEDVLTKTISLLKEKEQTVAVSGTPGTEPLKELGEQAENFYDVFTFTPHMEDKGEYNLTDYAALLAKSSKELANTTYGASISEIGTGDGGDFICITVADDKTALVRKLYREDDESREAFAKDAAEELLELVYEKSSGKGGVGIEVANATAEKSTGFFKTAGGKFLIAFLCILLAAVVTLGSLYIVREKKRQEEEKIASQTVETTTETTTIKIEEPIVETVPFSKLMYREMLEGIQEVPAETQTENNSGTAIDTSSQTKPNTDAIPQEIIVNGITMDAKEAVAKIVEAEMGNTYREEALKAQAVLVYTYLKYRETNWKITGVTLAETYSDEVYNAVRSVFGEYVSFDGKPAFTPYFKLSAGKTTTADVIYKKAFPYLRAVDSMSDKTNDAYKTELILPADEVKTMIAAYDAELQIPEDPKTWMKIEKHSGAVNTGIGYVESMKVCGKDMTGIEFIEKVFSGKNIPSTCFDITYNKTTNEFKITAYGNGLGVGMSQAGADKMAATGSSYIQILAKFFPGTKTSA